MMPKLCLASSLAILVAHLLLQISPIAAFTTTTLNASPLKSLHSASCNTNRISLSLAASQEDNSNSGVIDLTDDDDDDDAPAVAVAEQASPAAPFLSQGELSDDPNLLSPDFSDAKQTRVIIYIILTLVPVLFLIPLMIGSRDLIPLDALPPVEMN